MCVSFGKVCIFGTRFMLLEEGSTHQKTVHGSQAPLHSTKTVACVFGSQIFPEMSAFLSLLNPDGLIPSYPNGGIGQ